MDRDRSAEELIAAEALILMRYGFNAGTVQPAPPSASPPRVEALAAVPAASPSAASLPRADGSAESPAAMPVAAPAAEPVAAPAAAEAANNQGAPVSDYSFSIPYKSLEKRTQLTGTVNNLSDLG